MATRKPSDPLVEIGFGLDLPEGAYYVMTDITAFGVGNDVEFARHLVREIGVATVPGSSFFQDKALGSQFIRFCFCKREETLDEAIRRLRGLRVIESRTGHLNRTVGILTFGLPIIKSFRFQDLERMKLGCRFEPQSFYENYRPDCVLAGASPRFVPVRPPGWTFDPDELAAAFNDRTKAIVLCNPNNPTGTVFTREELEQIADLCRKWDVVTITDEIYEHIVFDGRPHVALATLPGMKDRTVTIGGMSKTYAVTGWRVGTMIAPAPLTHAFRQVHDYVSIGAAAPLQAAGAVAYRLPRPYYDALAADYQARRDKFCSAILAIGFELEPPQGAYYVMAGISAFGAADDVEFARHLVREVGVATVPGSSFFRDKALGRGFIRFCFCKKDETLDTAIERLRALRAAV